LKYFVGNSSSSFAFELLRVTWNIPLRKVIPKTLLQQTDETLKTDHSSKFSKEQLPKMKNLQKHIYYGSKDDK
jgi:hypothetical protein